MVKITKRYILVFFAFSFFYWAIYEIRITSLAYQGTLAVVMVGLLAIIQYWHWLYRFLGRLIPRFISSIAPLQVGIWLATLSAIFYLIMPLYPAHSRSKPVFLSVFMSITAVIFFVIGIYKIFKEWKRR